MRNICKRQESEICKRQESEQIIAAVISLAHGLGIVATAEGIEDQTQMSLLKHMECDFGQGYLLGKPMPAEDVHAFLRSGNERAWPRVLTA